MLTGLLEAKKEDGTKGKLLKKLKELLEGDEEV